MPLLVSVVAAWLTGAALAALRHDTVRAGAPAFSSGALVVLGVASAIAVAVGVLGHHRHRAVAWVFVVGIAGVLAGHAAWQRDATCRRALGDPDVALLVRIDARAAPRAWIRGDARSAAPELRHCRVPVSVAVASGEAPPGAWVRVDAQRLAAGRMLRLDAATVTPTGAVDWVRGWRGRTGETIDSLFGDRAPLVRALVVADQHGIAPDVRDKFATAGLVHVLSISGLHVAIIAGALRTFGAAMRLRRTHGDLVAVFGVLAYVTALGFPPPATRAATMLVTMALTTRLSRPVHPWTALALGVAIPTFDPRVVLALGWQLSASGMAALVGARAVLRRWRALPLELAVVRDHRPWPDRVWRRVRRAGPQLEGWRWALTRELVVSTAASVVTAPLVAWAFGRVSLVSPLSNLLASPVVTFLQPTLFLALVLAPVRPVARLVADASAAPLAALDIVATRAADLPFAALDVAPGRFTALCMGIMAAALVFATARRRVWPPLLVGATALVVALWVPAFRRGPGVLEFHMLDVGQGDALALRTPRGRWILFDAGRVWQGGDAGRRTVVPYVRRRGGEVALFVLSHPDADHVGGAASILDALRPARWWDPGFVHGSAIYQEALATATRTGVPWRRAHVGDSLRIDGVLLRVLGPDSLWTASSTNANDASAVVMVQHGRVRFLLTGDAESAQEAWLVDHWGDALSATVLKVGHHGSRTSTTDAFLAAVNPTLALVSVGAGNRYGHPAPDVVARLRAAHVDIVRTDRDGAIVVRTDGRSLTVETRHTSWTHVVP